MLCHWADPCIVVNIDSHQVKVFSRPPKDGRSMWYLLNYSQFIAQGAANYNVFRAYYLLEVQTTITTIPHITHRDIIFATAVVVMTIVQEHI